MRCVEIELQYLYTGDGPLMVPAELATFALAKSEIFDIRDTFFDTPAGLLERIEEVTGRRPRLALIGELENRRSTHDYVQGLHHVEMCWDRLRFPLGPPQTRLELETMSDAAGRFIGDFDAELRQIFDGDLADAEHGKAKELCVRLYPEVFGATAA